MGPEEVFAILTSGKEFSLFKSLSNSLSCLSPLASGFFGVAFCWRALNFGINHLSFAIFFSSSSAILSHLSLNALSFVMNVCHHWSWASIILWEPVCTFYERSLREIASFPPSVGRTSFSTPSGKVERMVIGSPSGIQVLSLAQLLYCIFAFLSLPRKNVNAWGYLDVIFYAHNVLC